MEVISRVVENARLTGNVGNLVDSIFSRDFPPKEYQLNLWIHQNNIAIRVYTDTRQIIIENFDGKGHQISMSLKTTQNAQESFNLIDVNVMKGKKEDFRNLAKCTITKNHHGKWNLDKWEDNLFDHLKAAKPTLLAINQYLNFKDRQTAEAKRRVSGSWSYLDLEEAPRSNPVVDYVVNENDNERPLTQFSLFVPGTPAEAREGQVGHIRLYKIDGKQIAETIVDGKRLEIYKVDSVLDTKQPQYVLLARQRISDDVDYEEISVIFGNVFSLNELRKHIAHSLLGEVFDEWLKQTKAEQISALRARRGT